jgi:hypothetical protein
VVLAAVDRARVREFRREGVRGADTVHWISKPPPLRAPDADYQPGSSGEVAYRQCKPYFSSCPELDFRRDASRTSVGRGRGYGTRTTSAESSLKSRTSHWHIR